MYATDANGTAHYTTDSVRVSLLSTAPSVGSLDSSSVLIPIGGYFNNAAGWTPGVIGTTQLQASDARAAYYRYNPAAANLSVYEPTMGFSWSSTTLGIGQYIDNMYAYTPDNQPAPTIVSLSHGSTVHTSALVSGSPVTSLTIASGLNYAYFRLLGTSTGTDSLIATVASPAHLPGYATTVVGPGRVDTPSGWPSSIVAGDSVLVTLYARDPSQNPRTVAAGTTFMLASSAAMVFHSGGATITSATIPADAQYVQFYLKGVSAGTANISVSATNYQTWNTTVTISP